MSIRIAFLLIALFLAGAAIAQDPEPIVRYRVVDDATGAESVARLDFGWHPDRGTYVLITQFFAPEIPGEPGTYKVFAGFVERGGLGIPYARVLEAKDSFQVLKRPGLLLRTPGSFKPGFSCQIDLGLPGLPFSCSGEDGSSQTGRMIRLRPSAPAIPDVLREDIAGFYRVMDEEDGEEGREALARLEFKDQDFSSQALLTLFSRPEGPDSLGTYKVFAGYVPTGAWTFKATVRELRNPYAVLRRPALLPAIPNQALVPNFACGLSAPDNAEIFYSCFDGTVLTQSGRMIPLR